MLAKELLHYCNIQRKESREILPSRISYYDLTLVLSGSLIYVINGTEYELQENDIIFLPPGTLRQRKPLNVHVKYVSFNFLAEDSADFPFERYIPNAISRDIRSMMELFAQEHISPFYHSKEKAICILNYILYDLFDMQQLKSNNAHITRALQFIRENLTKPLTLSSVSEHLHLSKEYTASLFKKEVGKTVVEYIHEERMRIAKSMIAEGDWELREIAERLGYENYGYFVRLFKKHFHTTPSRFMTKH